MFNEIKRPLDTIFKQNRFSPREVGLTHPDVQAYLRLCDDGSIEIVAAEGLSIMMNPKRRTMTFSADKIKFETRDFDGLRWNNLSFNEQATSYNEPTFNILDDFEMQNPYRGVSEFLDD